MRKAIIVLVILVFSLTLTTNIIEAKTTYPIPTEQVYVDISFDLHYFDLDGNDTPELYSGGWFWYNITITNEASCDFNTTYIVTIYNPDNTLNGNRTFDLDLKPQQTGALYPNNTVVLPNGTRLGEVDAQFADTAGAYKINVTSVIPAMFCRYAPNNSNYNYMYGTFRYSFDAMPSYQKGLNDKQEQFYQDSKNLTDTLGRLTGSFNDYADKADLEAAQIKYLTYVSIGISFMALVMTYFTIAKEEGWKRKSNLLFGIGNAVGAFIFMSVFPEYELFILIAYCIISGAILLRIFLINRVERKIEQDDIEKIEGYTT